MTEHATEVIFSNVQYGRLLRPPCGGDYRVRQWVEGDADAGGLYMTHVRLVLASDRDLYEPERFCILRRPNGPAVSAEGARTVPLGKICATMANRFGTVLTDDRAVGVGERPGVALRARGIDDAEVLALVGRVYCLAVAQSRPPAQAVANLLDCSIATAGTWISAAKRGGHLGHRRSDRRVLR